MSEAMPPLPQYAFMAWCSVKAQEQLCIYLNKVFELIIVVWTIIKTIHNSSNVFR
jgi:hypothetical protein